MRFAFTRVAILGCVFALASLAQQQLSVNQVVEFITSSVSGKMPDKDVTEILLKARMTEKLDSRTVEELQGKGAGQKTVAALMHLSETSTSLTPPPPPKAAAPKPKPIPPPSPEEQ